MKILLNQNDYWNKVAGEKTFNHEPDWKFLQKNIANESKILDFGSGYGRLVEKFANRGYQNIIGIDSSEKMIERARNSNKSLNYLHNLDDHIPFEDNNFDLILLFAVLTCIPLDEDQERLLSEIHRVLKTNGLLYISDLLINSDERNMNRYKENKGTEYGVFKLTEGVTLRHHSIEYLENEILSDFRIVYKNFFEVSTMNKNKSKAIQIIGSKK